MPRRGSRELRNAGHKARRAALLAEARTDAERLAAAYGWFRSSVALLARRRPPYGIGRDVHPAIATRLMREMTGLLLEAARAIDRGDYDAKGAA
jgi:hypothetical protein